MITARGNRAAVVADGAATSGPLLMTFVVVAEVATVEQELEESMVRCHVAVDSEWLLSNVSQCGQPGGRAPRMPGCRRCSDNDSFASAYKTVGCNSVQVHKLCGPNSNSSKASIASLK